MTKTQRELDYNLAQSYMDAGRYPRAAELLARLYRDYLAASIAMSRRDHAAALAHLDTAAESAARTPGFHLQVGHAYLELRRYDDADHSYRRVLEIDRENPNAHIGLCRGALKQQRNQDALAAARAAVGLKYHSPPAHYFLAIAQHRLGDHRAAIASLRLAIEQNPNFAEAHSRLALIHTRDGDPLGAAEHRLAALQIRRQRRQARGDAPAVVLPDLSRTVIEQHLPEFPKPSDDGLRPPLAVAPIARAISGSGSGSGSGPGDSDPLPDVIIVSGLPRSGTSMMMQMLAAGGLPLYSDGQREADPSNPRGYFESEQVKGLQRDNGWLAAADDQAIKVIAPLLPYLPQQCRYRVLLIERDLDEVLGSQGKMLDRLGREGGRIDDEQLGQTLSRQLEQALQLLAGHDVPLLRIAYRDALRAPRATAGQVAESLAGKGGAKLDQAAMAQAVAPELYRQRGA